MKNGLLNWDMYEIRSSSTKLNGVMLRGRIRKLCLEKNKNLMIENASDIENVVRFCVISGEDITQIEEYLQSKINDVEIKKIKENVQNPILSKLKTNLVERYTL